MKSLKDYSLNISEEEYHNLPAWSYSVISKYAKEGFGIMPKLHEKVEPTPAMEFGSLFDAFITRPMDVENEYAVCDVSVPAAEKKVLEATYSMFGSPKFESVSTSDVIKSADACEYQMRWGADTRYKHIAEYSDYYDLLASGKKLVSKEDWDDAVEMERMFRNDEYLKRIFGQQNTEDVEYIYQSKFVVDYETSQFGDTVQLKIMPDLLVVNHKEKTVLPVDLKTSAMPAWQFKENFVKYRYDIQSSLYTDVLRKVMDNTDEYKDYSILPYLFTAISRSDMVPVTYRYDPKDFTQEDGLSFTVGDKTIKYKGWKVLLQEIRDYEASQAVVPSYIKTKEPNDIILLLSK